MITLEEFKNLCTEMYPPDILVQKYLIDGSTYFFENIAKGEEFFFKKDIANRLNTHIREIVIVGSGKLGFSLKPEMPNVGLYLYKSFDYNYNNDNTQEKSDLDIGIVSSSLFDEEIKNLYNHFNYYKNSPWKGPDRNSFAQFVLKGRLATYLLPTGAEFNLTKAIINIQEEYKMKYGRDINIEIYKSWYFFETYHQENIKNIQINLIG